MKNNFKILSILSLLMIITQTACITTPVGITSSVTPMQGKKIEQNLGKTEGSDSAISILGLWMIGKPDINEAIQEAVDAKKADTLINVKSYEKYTWYILFSTTSVIVEGEAIKLKGTKK